MNICEIVIYIDLYKGEREREGCVKAALLNFLVEQRRSYLKNFKGERTKETSIFFAITIITIDLYFKVFKKKKEWILHFLIL